MIRTLDHLLLTVFLNSTPVLGQHLLFLTNDYIYILSMDLTRPCLNHELSIP